MFSQSDCDITIYLFKKLFFYYNVVYLQTWIYSIREDFIVKKKILHGTFKQNTRW